MIPDRNVTSDGFWIAIEHQEAKVDSAALNRVLEELGASRIQHEYQEILGFDDIVIASLRPTNRAVFSFIDEMASLR